MNALSCSVNIPLVVQTFENLRRLETLPELGPGEEHSTYNSLPLSFVFVFFLASRRIDLYFVSSPDEGDQRSVA